MTDDTSWDSPGSCYAVISIYPLWYWPAPQPTPGRSTVMNPYTAVQARQTNNSATIVFRMPIILLSCYSYNPDGVSARLI